MANLPIWPVDYPWRLPPAEYIQGIGWIQAGHIRNKVKPKYHFIWPKDGKRGSKWGRMKDIAQNKGPDIHVTISADKMDYMHNRQRKPRWSRHTNLDDRGPDYAMKGAPWTRNTMLGGRNPNLAYDFYQRKYIRPDRWSWTDAIWQGPNKNSKWPHAWRDNDGFWWQDII